jgi:hypothetical protein
LVVAAGVEDQLAEEFAGGALDGGHVEVLDEELGWCLSLFLMA